MCAADVHDAAVPHVDDLLARAREGWTRMSAAEAYEAVEAGALLVDTRTAAQRARTGDLPGALVIDRTVLEWRLDPTSPNRIPEADARPRIVVVCRQGFSSSLAARSPRDRCATSGSTPPTSWTGWRAGSPPACP